MNIQNTQNTLRMTLVTLAAMSATMLAGVTHAAAFEDNQPSQAVTYTDLNLYSNAGVQVLYKRIESAANQVCGLEGPQKARCDRSSRHCARVRRLAVNALVDGRGRRLRVRIGMAAIGFASTIAESRANAV